MVILKERGKRDWKIRVRPESSLTFLVTCQIVIAMNNISVTRSYIRYNLYADMRRMDRCLLLLEFGYQRCIYVI